MENGKRPINARTAFNSHGAITSDFEEYNGLTKREYFAGLAMQGLMSNPEFIRGGSFDFESRKTAEKVSSISIKVSDERLKQLE